MGELLRELLEIKKLLQVIVDNEKQVELQDKNLGEEVKKINQIHL